VETQGEDTQAFALHNAYRCYVAMHRDLRCKSLKHIAINNLQSLPIGVWPQQSPYVLYVYGIFVVRRVVDVHVFMLLNPSVSTFARSVFESRLWKSV
jgi:hypothetical protein